LHSTGWFQEQSQA